MAAVARPRQTSRLVGPAVVLAVIVLVWHLATAMLALVSPTFLPPPGDVVESGLEQILKSSFWLRDVRTTLAEFALGYAVSVGVAIPIGALIGRSKLIASALEPYVIAFYAMPRVALIPLIVLWFGISYQQKVVMVLLGAFFPMCINTIAGVRNVDRTFVMAARSLCASPGQLMRFVVLPASVPYLLAGARISLLNAYLLTIFAEMYSSNAGLGYRIAVAGNAYQPGPLIFLVVVTMLIGLLLDQLIRLAQRSFVRYRSTSDSS